MDPRETEYRVRNAELLMEAERKALARQRRAPFWGRDREERWNNIGLAIGLAVVFGIPLLMILWGWIT